MKAKVLIIEDEMLVAGHLEMLLEDLGFQPVGVAADSEEARSLVEAQPDIALVDCNLRDGPTGPQIGAWLASKGIEVIFLTANPGMLGSGVEKTLGVISKPCGDDCIGAVMDYAISRRSDKAVTPPPQLKVFH